MATTNLDILIKLVKQQQGRITALEGKVALLELQVNPLDEKAGVIDNPQQSEKPKRRNKASL